MNTIEFTVTLGLGSLVAGFLGALTGLGSGVVIVPLLVLGFGVDIHYAIGASLGFCYRYVVRRRGCVRPRRLLEYPSRNVPRDRDDGWRAVGGEHRRKSLGKWTRDRVRSDPAVVAVLALLGYSLLGG